jgi:multidrug resistance efflux pump
LSDFAVADATGFAKERMQNAQYQTESVSEREALNNLERLSDLLESGVISEDECEMLRERIDQDR